MKYVLVILTLLLSSTAIAQEPPQIELPKFLLAPTPIHPLTRDIYIQDVIDMPLAFSIRDQLQDLNEASAKEITVHVSSPGGSVLAGLAIYDYLTEGRSPIKTICEGYCMSMAATLLMAGDVREATENATIMFHTLASESKGHLQDMKADLAESERLQMLIDTIIHARSGLPLDTIRAMESYDHYMSPQEAKTLNLIDKIRVRHAH